MENHEGHDHSHEGHDHAGHDRGHDHADHAVAATGKATDRERVLGAISYIGPLFVVSYLMAENSKFVKFHASQGLVFFLAAIVVKVVLGAIVVAIFIPAVVTQRYGMGMMYGFGGVGMVVNLIMLAIVILAVFAIVKAAQGEQWEMPVIGKWAKKMQI